VKRQEAKNDLEKDFYKLMNNACYGKSLDNTRNRRVLNLVFTTQKCLKLNPKPQFGGFKIINENLALIDRIQSCVLLYKPMYAGLSILELSKLYRYDFHYNTVKKVYNEKAIVCFTDTDSFLYKLTCNDYYEDLCAMYVKFDTSNCDVNLKTNTGNVVFSKVNAKVIGTFKDQCSSEAASEFVGLRSKCTVYL
jgi:hypothetical protein